MTMRTPNFKTLIAETDQKGFYSLICEASFMHPNPRYYKYYWWIFWQGSTCDGLKFLSKKNRLSTKTAFDLIEKLKRDRQSYWVYNRKLPRLDPNNPFDPNAKVWRKTEWAKSFDEDPDEEVNGFK